MEDRFVEGEVLFNKTTMTGNVHVISSKIETPVTMMIGTVTEKDTWKGTKIHFVFYMHEYEDNTNHQKHTRMKNQVCERRSGQELTYWMCCRMACD